MNKISLKKIKVALGIITRKGLTGPIEVSLDLTRKCNGACLMCWYWTPLLKTSPPQEWLSQQIDFDLFKRLIEDFKKLQVKRIVLGGQGEPLLYPKIFEAIETLKRNHLEVALITGGPNLDERTIRNIFDLGVDYIDVSIQAATPATYLKMHPTQKEETFERIKECLLLLSQLKRKFKRKFPAIRLIDVICNANYLDTVKIVELAKEVKAESIGFKRIDVIPQTRDLLLNNEQLSELRSLLKEAKEKATRFGIHTSIDFYQEFILKGLTTGIYTSTYYSKIPCYAGWVSSRILSDGSVVPCCGCYDTVFGNINNSSFTEIWYSEQYHKFRLRALNINKDTQLRAECNCHSCVDFGFNLGIYRKLHPLRVRRIY